MTATAAQHRADETVRLRPALPVVYRTAAADYLTAKGARDLAAMVVEARGETHRAVTVAVAALGVALLAVLFGVLALLWVGVSS